MVSCLKSCLKGKLKMLWLLTVIILLKTCSIIECKARCGGIYKAKRGILQTPGFPDKLPVPLQCEWIIDAQNFATYSNTSIKVYFTQLYVQEGLKFTEYQLYDRAFSLDGRIIHIVNETNVVQVRYIQSFQNFLVVTLNLDSVDSVHLRVLYNYLDVFGFNITYEITNLPPRSDACSAMDCGFTGICYDYFTKFRCECFMDYSGPHCSSGLKSLCENGNEPSCKNGATCLHVGASAIKCLCPENFTGSSCDIQISSIAITKYCDSCTLSLCTLNEKSTKNSCNCNDIMKNFTMDDRSGFIVTMHFSNLPNIKEESFKSFLQSQILKTIKLNSVTLENIIIPDNELNFKFDRKVQFYLFAKKKDEKRIKVVFNKWTERGHIANLTLKGEPVLKPLLNLQSVTINQDIVRENDEFILSCMAQGSPTIMFRWFKDGIFINVTKTKGKKWTRLIKDPYLDDQYTGLLGIRNANALDDGTFTCQAEDFNVHQCISRRVFVRIPPVIRVEPMSITVKKGNNFTIKCHTINENGPRKYSYSWTKNKELLPSHTDKEKYEILYPGGSILQVYNIDKSSKYSCLVQDDAISNEVSIIVHVIDPNLVRTCPNQKYLNIYWPETAPDTQNLQECPKEYTFTGYLTRSCSLKDGFNPIWQLTDYSQCTLKFLFQLQHDFQLLQLGYEVSSLNDILKKFYQFFKNYHLMPGEGMKLLEFLKSFIEYSDQFLHVDGKINTTKNLLEIINHLLLTKDSIINQDQVEMLQKVIKHLVHLSDIMYRSTLHFSFSSIDVTIIPLKHVNFSTNLNSNTSQHHIWTPKSLQLYYSKINTNSKLSIITFKNLVSFLPHRSIMRLKDGAEEEYEILSEILRLWMLTNETINNFQFTIEWKLDEINLSKEGWHLKCAITQTDNLYVWNTSLCLTELNINFVRCTCPNTGTIALLLTNNYVQMAKNQSNPRNYIVLAGCSISFFLILTSSTVLIVQWFIKQTCVTFLKIQCSASMAGVILTFILTTISEPSEKFFSNILAIVECLILMALSSQVSTLLLIYTEIMDLPRTKASKHTVIGISTGVPIISVFGNHLAHRTMNIHLQSWWLIIGTLAFNIFVTVTSIIFGLFFLIYGTVHGKLSKINNFNERDIKSLQEKIVLFERTAIVFFSIIFTTISSILYINIFDSIWWQYEFGISTMITGLILFLCFILKTNLEFLNFGKKFGSKSDNNFYETQTSHPMNLFISEDVEFQNKSSSRKNEMQSTSSKCCFPSESGLPKCISTNIDCETKNYNLENYSQSPKALKKINTGIGVEQQNSPDILSSKLCTELDLVADHATNNFEKSPENDLKFKRTEPDGREKHCPTLATGEIKIIEPSTGTDEELSVNKKSQSTNCKTNDNLDCMLDKISHDLDYLLNRSIEELNILPKTALNKTSKFHTPPIREEDEEDFDTISVTLRTKC